MAASDWDFISFVNNLMADPERRRRMRDAARRCAYLQSWDSVFERVYQTYESCRPASQTALSNPAPLLSSRLHGRGGS